MRSANFSRSCVEAALVGFSFMVLAPYYGDANKSPALARTRRSRARLHLSPSPLALSRLRLGLAYLNAVQDELVVASLWSIFHAAEKSVRRAVAVAALHRGLGDAMILGHLVVAKERIISDNNALRVRFT